MNQKRFAQALLYYIPQGTGVLIDPCDQWLNVKLFLASHEIQLKYLLLSDTSFEKAFQIAEIQKETGAKFLSFRDDLLTLRNLPREADKVNVCGVKIPHVDQFLDGVQNVNLDGVTLRVVDRGNMRDYLVDDIIP